MKIRISILVVFIVFIFTACNEDFFEQTVSIDLTEHTPRLAVTARFAAGDTTLRVYLTHTLGVLENRDPDTIPDATVELFKNGQSMAVFLYEEGIIYEALLPEPLSATPAEYRLRVSAPGFDAVEAVQIMPAMVPILSATYEVEGAVNSDGEKVDELTVEFQDPAGEENYYTIDARLFFEGGTYQYQVYLENLDPLAEDLGGEPVIKDSSFDGKKYKWRFTSYSFGDPGAVKLVVWLRSISKDEYLFLKSVDLYQNNEDNPFAEPVIIHSNIASGDGIFSLKTWSGAEIEL